MKTLHTRRSSLWARQSLVWSLTYKSPSIGSEIIMDDHIVFMWVCAISANLHIKFMSNERFSFLFSQQLVGQLHMGDNHSSLRIEGNGNKHSYFSHLQRACLAVYNVHLLLCEDFGGNGNFWKSFWKVWCGIEVEKMTWNQSIRESWNDCTVSLSPVFFYGLIHKDSGWQ